MKKIAMKCTQEQFDAVMPRLSKKGFTLNSVTCFEKYPYLYCNVGVSTISNVDKEILEYLDCKEIHETWNEKIFIEACGIEVEEKPTLEEVKKYFKNAEKIKDHAGDVGFIEFDKIRFSDDGTGVNQNAFTKNWLVLWHHEKGFAKILTTKEKTFSITAGQLRQLTDPKLKEWFPEVFKVKLEVGKWYKSDTGGLWYVEKITKNGQISFGINYKGGWSDSGERQSTGLVEATDQEVFEALKNEAEKIGYKKGNYKCLFINDFNKFESLKICYDLKKDTLWLENGVVYKKGVWAKIIPTCTRAEAEKLLNKKIID